MSNPLDNLATLTERLREAAKALGLKLETMAFLPGVDGNPHLCQAILSVDSEVFEAPEDMEATALKDGVLSDDEAQAFASLEAQFSVEKKDDATENIKASGKSLLDELRSFSTEDGLGLDGDDE